MPLVYDELRKLAAARLAQEKPGQTLQATALVHEAYLRLVDASTAPKWNSRGHFFAAAQKRCGGFSSSRPVAKGLPNTEGDRIQIDINRLTIEDFQQTEKQRRCTKPERVSTWPRWPSSGWCTRTSRTCRPKSGRTSSGTRSSMPIRSRTIETLVELDPYKPLVTYDNLAEIGKLKKYAPHAGLVLRIRVPNTGAVVELSSKFGASSGEAVDLIEAAFEAGLMVEGLELSRRQPDARILPTTCRRLNLAAAIFEEAQARGYPQVKMLDIGGGFPAPYDKHVRPFRELAKTINTELNRLFPKDIEILAEPGRFLVATAATAGRQRHRQSRPRRQAVLLHQRRRLSHLLGRDLRPHPVSLPSRSSAARRKFARSSVRRAIALDTISLAEELPDLELGDLIYSENVGAYTHASSTHFNGFPPAKVVHVNR